jgi:hypothetical protein
LKEGCHRIIFLSIDKFFRTTDSETGARRANVPEAGGKVALSSPLPTAYKRHAKIRGQDGRRTGPIEDFDDKTHP